MLGTEEVIKLTYYFYVFDISNEANDGILLKEVPGYILGLVYFITQKYTLGIPLGAYDTLGPNLFFGIYDVIFIKQCANNIGLHLQMI